MEPSDPTIDDSNRTGDDLIARLRELHREQEGNGWRALLYACDRDLTDQRRTIKRLLRDLKETADMLRRVSGL